MTPILVDSNIILDVATQDPVWAERSSRVLAREAAFLAGKCFLAYRRRGGARTSTLPDFYIGAHAALAGYRLLTRNAARYRTCFPGLEILVP